ncbi:MAG: class I SAM-dependent methyltransferase [Bacteroidetes bacterium]|nr:class I SAM-dependent methyltransferase [Bacteroidota bacterium]MCL1969353.1 class I SAM-dependent methyltransferase [Bacteroidota bacterium]
MMNVDVFFELFLKELQEMPAMWHYYKFLNNKSSFEFRKAYFVQRLQYVANQITDRNSTIWDCGCGYGTTALFLAMNGFRVYGTTLEFYFDEIEKRKNYWKQYGDVSLFEVDYANVFDQKISDNSFDYIILQDTLHHIEPLQDALRIFNNVLKQNGKIIVNEVNGNNIMENLKFFKQRGNKRVITIWDERLQKNILFGNENVRSFSTWKQEFVKAGFSCPDEPEYIRFYFPFTYHGRSADKMIAKEDKLRNKKWIREYLFFGINFTIKK